MYYLYHALPDNILHASIEVLYVISPIRVICIAGLTVGLISLLCESLVKNKKQLDLPEGQSLRLHPAHIVH